MAFLAAFGQILVANRSITGALGSMLQAVPLYERAKPILEAVPEVVHNAQDPGRFPAGSTSPTSHFATLPTAHRS